MAEPINDRNIGAYLAHLAEKIKQPLPAPYNNAANLRGRSPAEIATLLEELYARMGIPRQTGWSIEDSFLKLAPATETSATLVTPLTQQPPNSSAAIYLPVAGGIGRSNFKPFLYWMEERLKRPLDLTATSAWDQYSDEGIRHSLPVVYQAARLSPDEAKQLELGFLAVYHQKVAPMPVASTLSQSSVVNPLATPPLEIRKTIPSNPSVQQALPRRKRRFPIPILVLLLAAGLIGFWLFRQYSAFSHRPFVYALTNNIALRKDATDNAAIAGRMDLYGNYLDTKGAVQTSASSLPLSDEQLKNGFYMASTTASFWNYLTGKDSIVYVHTKYVTTDKSVYEHYAKDLEALKNDYNELDKLGFIYRQLIGRANLVNNTGAPFSIAASCRPSPKLSKIAPLSLGKYRNKATGELDVFIQATDGFCYTLRGGDNELPPTITPVIIQFGLYTEPMKAGGMLTKQGSNGGLRFEYCLDGQVYYSQPPYTMFLPLPEPIQPPENPVEPDDSPTVPADSSTFF